MGSVWTGHHPIYGCNEALFCHALRQQGFEDLCIGE
jgi:hypothetical protein